ncbi:MAG: HPP family protein [Coxiellaceae bacterium]|nr:HPP family protein [Coxiellaceae bacterium]
MNKSRWAHLIWQPLIAVMFVIVVLLFMDHFASSDVLWAVGAGALSSSSYIVFGKPSGASAQPKNILGGYLVGIIVGFLLRIVIMHLHDLDCGFLGTAHFHLIGLIAAFSVGMSLFVMSLLKFEHPPAAGMALVLVIDMRDYDEILLVLIAAVLLAIIRRLLSKKLVDLA